MSDTKTSFSHPWPEDSVANIGTVTVGGTPRTSVDKYWDGDVPWMASGDVHLKRVTDVPKRITQLGLRYSNATLVDPPAVAIGLAGQGKTRGTVALVLCRLSTNQSVALITGNASKVDAEYLFHNLEFRYEELRSRSAGGGRAGLSKQLIEQIPIPLPCVCEQTKIAEILTTVNRVIEQTEALIAKQQRIKTGLTQDLLTRGIDEHGNLRSESTHRFKHSPLGRIPVEWQIVCLNEVAQISSGLTLGKSYEGLNTIELPYLRVANVQDGYFDLSELKTIRVRSLDAERFHLRAGDVLMNEGGDFDKLGRGSVWQGEIDPCLHQNHVFKVRPHRTVLSADFLAAVSSSPYGKAFFVRSSKQSTNLASINSTQLKAFPIPLPKYDEQVTIDSMLKAQNDCLAELMSEAVKFRSLKAALMQDLLTGKKRVTPLLETHANR